MTIEAEKSMEDISKNIIYFQKIKDIFSLETYETKMNNC